MLINKSTHILYFYSYTFSLLKKIKVTYLLNKKIFIVIVAKNIIKQNAAPYLYKMR